MASGEKSRKVLLHELKPDLVDMMNDGFAIRDTAGRFVYVNQRLCEMLGYTEEELIDDRVDKFLTPRSRAAYRNEDERRANAGDDASSFYELTWTAKDGQEVVTLISARPTPRFDGVFAVVTDITQLKQVERDLLETTQKYETLLSNLPGMAYRCDYDEHWTMRFISEGCLQLTGYARADLIGNQKLSFSDVIHPDDRGVVRGTIDASVSERKPFAVEYRIKTRASGERWVSEWGRAVYDEDNTVTALEGFIEDYTVQKQLEDNALPERIGINQRRLQGYYDINTKQASMSFWYSVVACSLGLVVLLIAVALAIAEKGANISAIVGVFGVVGEFIGASFFFIYRRSLNQLNYFYRELLAVHDTMWSIRLCDELPHERRSPMRERIIEYLLTRARLEGVVAAGKTIDGTTVTSTLPASPAVSATQGDAATS